MRLFLSIVTASRERLGYDSTCRLHSASVKNAHPDARDKMKKPEVTRVFEYDVFDQKYSSFRTFRTVSRIYDRGADALVGRGGRIWEVEEVGKENEGHRVLNDSWIESDRKPEDRILDDIKRKIGRGDPRLRHFLTVLCACIVPLVAYETVNGTRQILDAKCCDVPGAALDVVSTFYLIPPPPSPVVVPSHSIAGHQSSLPERSNEVQPIFLPPSSREARARLHHRMVYEEHGQPARHSPNLTK